MKEGIGRVGYFLQNIYVGLVKNNMRINVVTCQRNVREKCIFPFRKLSEILNQLK